MEERALVGSYGKFVLGLLRDGPLLAGQRRKTAPRGPMAAQCHMEAEEELEGAQESDGKWWEPEWRSPERVR